MHSRNGQAALEILLVLAAMLGIFGLLLTATLGIRHAVQDDQTRLNHQSETRQCALISNTLFANTLGTPTLEIGNCAPRGAHEIGSLDSNDTASYTISPDIAIIRTGPRTILEVQTLDHYFD